MRVSIASGLSWTRNPLAALKVLQVGAFWTAATVRGIFANWGSVPWIWALERASVPNGISAPDASQPVRCARRRRGVSRDREATEDKRVVITGNA